MATDTATDTAACVHCGLPRDDHSPRWLICPVPPQPGGWVLTYLAPDGPSGVQWDEWAPYYDDPRSVVPRALEFVGVVGPDEVLDKLTTAVMCGMEHRVWLHIRAMLRPGPWEIPPTAEDFR